MRKTLTVVALLAGLSTFSPGTSLASSSSSRAMLRTTLPEVNFSAVGLSDAIDFLRDVSGANVVVNWKALEEAGVAKDSPVNVRLHNVSLRKALDMVLTEAAGGDKLSYDIDQNVLEVTTKELADARMFTRVYPIEDLIMEIPDFTDAPDLSLNSTSNNTNQNPGSGSGASGGSGGSSGSGGSLFEGAGGKEKAGPTKAERAKALVDLIESLIQPETWVENGGKSAIRYWNGNLIVTAPRSVQEAIGGAFD